MRSFPYCGSRRERQQSVARLRGIEHMRGLSPHHTPSTTDLRSRACCGGSRRLDLTRLHARSLRAQSCHFNIGRRRGESEPCDCLVGSSLPNGPFAVPVRDNLSSDCWDEWHRASNSNPAVMMSSLDPVAALRASSSSVFVWSPPGLATIGSEAGVALKGTPPPKRNGGPADGGRHQPMVSRCERKSGNGQSTENGRRE